jgi:hypothetical protein
MKRLAGNSDAILEAGIAGCKSWMQGVKRPSHAFAEQTLQSTLHARGSGNHSPRIRLVRSRQYAHSHGLVVMFLVFRVGTRSHRPNHAIFGRSSSSTMRAVGSGNGLAGRFNWHLGAARVRGALAVGSGRDGPLGEVRYPIRRGHRDHTRREMKKRIMKHIVLGRAMVREASSHLLNLLLLLLSLLSGLDCVPRHGETIRGPTQDPQPAGSGQEQLEPPHQLPNRVPLPPGFRFGRSASMTAHWRSPPAFWVVLPRGPSRCGCGPASLTAGVARMPR